ncbi:hypothetical protein I317_06132 [Kwoniella heveanensis CBS 569]|nr:hypothetical protein I317_06132 [Kwoniella heveanensis CBS 569]
MTLLAKPSRSYANVQHDPDGLSSIGSSPYGVGGDSVVGGGPSSTTRKLSKKSDTSKVEGGFKTYRPPLAETHLRRPLGYDPHPDSKFAPLPPAFHLSSRQHKKDAALAGQRAELEHILQPEYKSSTHDVDGDSASIAGPSRHGGSRTAGGLGGLVDRKGKMSSVLRPSASISSFNAQANGNNGRRSGALGGVYIDSNGKLHDTEFDPFGHISEMSRAKSRRRSAFGSDRRKGSDTSSSSDSGSEVADQQTAARRSTDTGRERDREEEEIRRRLEIERKRLDDVSGYAAARRRSMMSERSGRATPSIRSSEDGPTTSIYGAGTGLVPGAVGRSRSQQGHYIPSPLSPTFGIGHSPSLYSSATSRTAATPHELKSEGTPPEKTTETTSRPRHETKSKIEVAKDGSKKITGFDAPVSPVPPYTPTMGNSLAPPPVPDMGRMSVMSRGSSDIGRDRPPKPAERPREDLFPETPAQIKRREERERRAGASSRNGVHPRANGLAVDTVIATSGKGRILPEIEIVEDDDPRIIFPAEGKSTRVQSKHDHVIRGPFSHALDAQGGYSELAAAGAGGRRASSAKSLGGGSKPSTIIDEDGGYLPSRWASGDRNLRITEDEREKYRPMEWKHGEPGGKSDHWEPTTKDQLKRNMKDIATSARFSLFRTKKKLLRKAEI